ncbi:hypothetical protein IFM89_035646 [Coptis chinensis]|uniref:Uncharacterized protein n=1 Tax=Coptis chinensis TaxID=261450 RepID=A0A835HIY8_9MAGN|nr:hypothetical protein IFM89_035646 [Coptis chinensis]
MDPGENSYSDLDMGVDETSDTPMEVNNIQDSSVERTGRGAVQCKRITKMREGELLNVQYNEDGQRIGEGGKDLASYSGLLAKSRISIVDYENWHAVGDEVRDLLWDTIKAKFNLAEDMLSQILGLELLIVRRTIKPRESELMMLAFVTSGLDPFESLRMAFTLSGQMNQRERESL